MASGGVYPHLDRHSKIEGSKSKKRRKKFKRKRGRQVRLAVAVHGLVVVVHEVERWLRETFKIGSF